MRKQNKKEKKPDTRFLECTKHGVKRWLPWSIVCTHLLNVESKEWVPLPQNGKMKGFDYFCPNCIREMDRIVNDRYLDNLRPICSECVKTIRRVFDPLYKEENNDGKRT